MSKVVVKAEGLTKKYKKKFANDNLSIAVNSGDIYGLVGRNGAGKTTFLKILLGLVKPNSGNVEMLGFGNEELNNARSQCGSIVEVPQFFDNMTAFNNLKLNAKLIGLEGDIDSKIENALKKVHLEKNKNDKVKSFSLGMKQLLGIANAILGEPKLLLLDEPMNGLDPIAIVEVRDVLHELNAAGTTIIVSSHILNELEKVATRYGFILDGKLVREISNKELVDGNLDIEKIFIETAKGGQ